MFYLLLGGFILALATVFVCTVRMTVFCEISGESWSGSIRLSCLKNCWGAEWSRSAEGQRLRLRFLFIPVSVKAGRLRKRSGKPGSKRKNLKIGQMRTLFRGLNQGLESLKKMADAVHIQNWIVDGQTSLWDPASTGKIFMLVQLMKQLKLIPVQVRIRPLFYPARSYVQCRCHGHFRPAGVIRLFFKDKILRSLLFSKS
ncbi:hypothetical protein JW948_19125 [bacterium]|nr:hypothetical protein [bacterium]